MAAARSFAGAAWWSGLLNGMGILSIGVATVWSGVTLHDYETREVVSSSVETPAVPQSFTQDEVNSIVTIKVGEATAATNAEIAKLKDQIANTAATPPPPDRQSEIDDLNAKITELQGTASTNAGTMDTQIQGLRNQLAVASQTIETLQAGKDDQRQVIDRQTSQIASMQAKINLLTRSKRLLEQQLQKLPTPPIG